MKLGAFNTLFYDRDFEPALEALKSYGCDAVEIGCGGFITKRYINPADIIEDDGACRKLAKTVEKYGLEISALRIIGYDYVLSIEHEDSLMSGEEGLEKAARFLKDVMIHKPTGAMWWD